MKKHSTSPNRFIPLLTVIIGLLGSVSVVAQQLNLGRLQVAAKGTGRTTGHIITLSVSNPTAQPQTLELPPLTIPSDGTHQGYAVPEPNRTTVPGNTTATIPIQGYCTDPDLPAPSPGVSLPPPNTWNPGSPILPVLKTVISVTTDLQQNGQMTTPFSGNPQREREAIIQQVVWYYSHPTVFDPCLHLRNMMTDWFRDTDWFSSGSPNIEQGIGQIADAMLQVGRISSLPDFRPPAPPITAPTPAQPPSNLAIANVVQVVGKGRTTGHIADLSVSNPTKDPIIVRIGDGGALYLPSSGQYQPYVVPSLPVIPVPPGGTVTVPIEGFCVDVRRPPVGIGEAMPPIQNWISGGPPSAITAPSVPEPMNPPGGTVVVSIPTQTAPPLSTIVGILQNQPPPPALSKWDCPDLPLTNRALIPGTDLPVTTPINPDQMPAIGVPLLLDAITRITRSYDELKPKGAITTPFSGNPDKEREAVIQQTFWMYSAALRGEPYPKDDFRDNTIKQFEQNTGRSFPQIPQPQQEQIDKGVDDFWNSFQATGVEAKILPKVPMEPRPEPRIDEFWNSFNDGGGKPKQNSTGSLPQNPVSLATLPENPGMSPEDQLTKNETCACSGSVKITVNYKKSKDAKAESTTIEVTPDKHRSQIEGIEVGATFSMDIDEKDLNLCKDKCKSQKCEVKNLKIFDAPGNPNPFGIDGKRKEVTVTEETEGKGKNAKKIRRYKFPERTVTQDLDKMVGGQSIGIHIEYECGNAKCGTTKCTDMLVTISLKAPKKE